MKVEIVRLAEGALMPLQGHRWDAGWDLYTLESTRIPPGGSVDVRTGIAIAIPPGFYGRIVHRSSTWRTHGLYVLEGTIDSGFRGELFAHVTNPNGEERIVPRHQRLAQLIICPVEPVYWELVDELRPSARGERGFGSTG